MALVDPETFDDRDIVMVYVAARVSEGKRVEQVLTANAIDYAVDVEPFENRVLGILRVEYEGIGFYVLADHAKVSRRVLHEAGLVQGLVEDDGD